MIHHPGRARLPFRRAPLRHDPDKTAELPDEAELINTLERTSEDCAEARRILSKTANFPPEIIDIVMDLAEYWVCSLASLDFSMTKKGEFSSYGGGERENRLLVIPPAPLNRQGQNDILLTLFLRFEPGHWASIRGIRTIETVGSWQLLHANWTRNTAHKSSRASSKGRSRL